MMPTQNKGEALKAAMLSAIANEGFIVLASTRRPDGQVGVESHFFGDPPLLRQVLINAIDALDAEIKASSN